ncbi:crossover junction endodeoxyribonuclease RuvC [Candidatus Peregrinibacteria bacterium CG10_big_fil_rev_8_21_14_0_10_36_19]|nr:MAG: crossover junction endodeoxyribonuclease RuvC [Candidatus Peregrinibacteria bacterium CG10_big_fil_rev_8_21_14_0_10_36_19]
MTRIIGIDPGTAITGYSIIDSQKGKITLVDYGCIRTQKGLSQGIRLNQIAQDITTLIKKYKPDQASIEKLFFKNNVTTAMTVSEARGVIMQKLAEEGINPEEFTPLQIKTAVCGYGKADKKMVQEMVKIITGLEKTPQPDDAADAIAAAICLANSLPLLQKKNEQ